MIRAIVGFLMIFGITLLVRIAVVNAQTASPTVSPSPINTVSPTNTVIMPSGAPNTGLGGN